MRPGSAAPSLRWSAAARIRREHLKGRSDREPVGEGEEPLTLARGSSVNSMVGVPDDVTAKAISAAVALPGAGSSTFPSAWIVQRRSFGWPSMGAEIALMGVILPSTRVSIRRGSPRTTSTESSEDRQGLRNRRLEVDKERGASRVGRRIDPGVDSAVCQIDGLHRRRASRKRRQTGRRSRARRWRPLQTPAASRRNAARTGRAQPCVARARDLDRLDLAF